MIGPLAIAFPNIDPVALHVGPLAIRWYGLAYVAGIAGAWLVLRDLVRRWELGWTLDDELTIVLAAAIGIVAGGRLGYVIFYNPAYYLGHPLQIFAIWDGGMSFHGGLAGMVAAGLVVARMLRTPFLTLADVAAVGVPIGLFFGRLANFVNDELWGRVTHVPWAVVFPNGGPAARHPSQLYEAFLEGIVLFAVLWVMSRRARPRGLLFGVLLAGYGVARIFVEFFRQPDAQIHFLPSWVTMGQLLSLPMVVAGAWLVWWASRPGVPLDGPSPAAPAPSAGSAEETAREQKAL